MQSVIRLTEEDTKFKVTNIRNRYPQIFDWLNFQDINVIIIILLMLIVAGFNMISGLLILILEKTNMIGVLKSLGSEDTTIRRVFLYQAAYLIGKGLFWGNFIGIGLAFLQLKTGIITLDPSSYYIKTVPVNLDLIHILLTECRDYAGHYSYAACSFTADKQDNSGESDKIRLEAQAEYSLFTRYRSYFQVSPMHSHYLS